MGAADLLQHVRAAGFTLDLADGKLLVTPASMLTDDLRAALRACKPELMALLMAPGPADHRHVVVDLGHHVVVGQRCGDCTHLLRRGTCAEPVAAGLLTAAEGFGIVWPPAGHGAGCPGFSSVKTSEG